jgi:hypothetical protein
MKEDFLHYLWRFQKLGRPTLKTVSLDPVTVEHPGQPNPGQRPDFIHAKIWIGDTLWAGFPSLTSAQKILL